MAAMDRFNHDTMGITFGFDGGFAASDGIDARGSTVFGLALHDILVMKVLMDLVPFVLSGQLIIAGGDFLCCHKSVFDC